MMVIYRIFIGTLLFLSASYAQAMDDTQKIAHFKQVLDTKDCEQIRQAAVALMWSMNTSEHAFGSDKQARFRLQWSVPHNSFVISEEGTNNDVHNTLYVTYGELLRDFVIREILYPTMYGTKSVADATAQIEILNGEKYTLENAKVKRKGIFGRTNWTEDAEMVIIALHKARNVPFISTNLIDDSLTSNALYKYVGSYVGLRKNSSSMTRLLWNKNSLSVVSIAAALGVGYIIHKKYYAAEDKDEDDEETAIDEQNADQASAQKHDIDNEGITT